ncbi:oxidase homolog protein B [Seminavis robusta]|uniref:Oxidase homolog protein B n=1 Tax=Seminavis robusta TaxID=568900 RepID=A0A9N8HXK3_9STRA|nr:oxidase homolog protein B [Seminavis robusta]|eukprot:Sro2235_g320170.1 oxidase homolog protein B (236) ;mRNA; f:4921-5745
MSGNEMDETAQETSSQDDSCLNLGEDKNHSDILQSSTCPEQLAVQDLVVKVEGPIGASSQGFVDYPILVLVGAGIGVTPMISVLKELLVNPGKMERVFFYWTVRDRKAFEWFSKLMDDVYQQDQKHVLQVRHFLTSVKDDDRDIGAILLHHATRAKHRASNFDLILGQQTHHQVEVGRPDWAKELKSVQQEACDLGQQRCGIFLCGPERMAEGIAKVSKQYSTREFKFQFNKETF